MDAPISSFSVFTRQMFSDPSLEITMQHVQCHSSIHMNILLYVMWLGRAQFGRLTKKQLHQLQALTDLWHQRLVLPLRQTYALFPEQCSEDEFLIKQAIRDEIDRALEVERDMLCASQIRHILLKRTANQQFTDACTSIVNYFEINQGMITPQDQLALVVLCNNIFSDIEKDLVQAQLDNVFAAKQKKAVGQLSWSIF